MAGHAKAHGSLGAVEAGLPQVVGDEEAVLGLESVLWDHDAGGGDCGPIGRARHVAIWLALAAEQNRSGQNGNQPNCSHAISVAMPLRSGRAPGPVGRTVRPPARWSRGSTL